MIIKVLACEETGLWKFYDKVSAVMARKVMVPEAVMNEAISDEIEREKFITRNGEEHTEFGMPYPHLFVSFFEDGGPVEIETNHDCFLMNDSGVTIERLF